MVQTALGVVGGGMISWMGVGLFRTRREVAQGGRDTRYSAFVAGILMSGLNPFFLVWWATVGSLLLMNFLEFSPQGLVLFIGVHWLCDLVWLSLVSFSIYKTRSFLSRRLQEWIFIACMRGWSISGGSSSSRASCW